MKSETFHLELITPCFCGGSEPDKQAEIRASSIRGQLRWWFRTLGGFKSLDPTPVRDQEALIFGSTAGDEGRAGKLIIRVSEPVVSANQQNADDLGATMNTPLGYALFPLRTTPDNDGRRGILVEQTRFSVETIWCGETRLFDHVRSLVAMWAHLGCLGFRGRRTVGALRLLEPVMAYPEPLKVFAKPNAITVHELKQHGFKDWRACSEALLKWYRSWRHHGQMWRRWDKHIRRWLNIPASQQQQNRSLVGFRWARRDHNEGLDVQGTGAPNPDPERPHGQPGETFRPALGLPIIQYFSSLGSSKGPLPRRAATVNWGTALKGDNDSQGRFASPVLLRPHCDAQGNWHALVIFVDARRWPQGKPVFLNGQPRAVSLALYEAMKNDPALKPFP